MDSCSNSIEAENLEDTTSHGPNDRLDYEDDEVVLDLNNDETDLTDNFDEPPICEKSNITEEESPVEATASQSNKTDSDAGDGKAVAKKTFIRNRVIGKNQKQNNNKNNKFINHLVNQRRYGPRGIDMSKPPSLLDMKPMKMPLMQNPLLKPIWNDRAPMGVPGDRKRTFGVDGLGVRPNLAPPPPMASDLLTMQKQNPLLMVVVDRAYPTSMLSPFHLGMFREAVAKEIDNCIDELPPRFEESALRKGAIVVLAVDPYACQWLRSKIHDIRPWDGAQLRVGGLELFRPLQKASIWVPGVQDEPTTVLQRLGRYNPSLDTESWRVNGTELRRFDEEEGRIFYMSIPDVVLSSLRELDFRPFYDLGRLHILIENELY